MAYTIDAPATDDSADRFVKLICWYRSNGDLVLAGEVVAEVEDKQQTLEVAAPIAGKLSILIDVNLRVKSGRAIGSVEPFAGGDEAALAKLGALSVVCRICGAQMVSRIATYCRQCGNLLPERAR